jgi:biotin transport system permease protein
VNPGPGALLTWIAGDSPVHRAPLWLKYLLLLAVGVLGTVWRTAPVGLGLLALSVALYALAGRRVLRAWPAPLRFWWWILALLGAYQWFFVSPPAAVGLIGCMFALVQLARLLLLTTRTAALLDGLTALATALRIPPARTTLVLALFLRTLPELSASWGRAREAAAARGVKRAPLRTATSLGVTAVARARDAGDAIAARGLLEARRPDEPAP